jgi:ABC-type branched-subunit amino acid transport system substrate-binding protein
MRSVTGTLASIALICLTLASCGGDAPDTVTPPPARSIASHGCSPVTYGGDGRPQFLIAASTALQGQFKDHGVQTAQALKLVLARHDWKAGDYRVGLQVCDETTAESDLADPRKCKSNARAFARNRSVLAVVGPHFSSCAAAMLPILSNAPGGGLAVVSGSTTYLGLTRSGAGVGAGEPGVYYRGGARNFVRTVPADDVQAAAAASYLRDHGARRPFALTDMNPYGEGLGDAFVFATKKLGLAVAGTARWNPKAKNYRELAARGARGDPDAVLVAGYVSENGPRLIKALRAALPHARFIGPDGMNQFSTIVEGAGESAEGFLSTIAVLPNKALPGPGRAFSDDFRRHYSQLPCCFSVHHAQAAEMALNAIADSGGSRSRVKAALFHMRVTDGLIGNFAIDRFGDTTLTKIGVYSIRDGQSHFEGAVSPPANLLGRR